MSYTHEHSVAEYDDNGDEVPPGLTYTMMSLGGEIMQVNHPRFNELAHSYTVTYDGFANSGTACANTLVNSVNLARRRAPSTTDGWACSKAWLPYGQRDPMEWRP